MTPELACPKCAHVGIPRLTWVNYQASGQERRHLRADCRRCGRYIQFVPQTPAWLRLAEELMLVAAFVGEEG